MMHRTLVLVAVVVGGLVMRPSGQTAPPRTNRAFVPAEATIEPLARAVRGGNAVLRVRFEDGARPPERLTYQSEYGTVLLADDGRGFDVRAGDGLYTALGSMDLLAARARIERLAKSRTAMPTRTWRHRSKADVQAVMDPRLWRAGKPFPWEPWGDPAQISQSRSLLITDLGVVEDPTRTTASCGQPSMGVWSFGYLMEQMANTPVTGVTGAAFARAWLDRWMTAQTVNDLSTDARTMMQAKIIDPWVAASGGANVPLDLAQAPFRLLAIVNRLDLRDQAAYGGTSGGELRFVFAHMRPNCVNDGRPFEVIFEFGVPVSGCPNLKALAAQWKALGSLPLGSPQYNAALEAITEQVVVANAGGSKPNGSALNQLRTNENHLDDTGEGLDWQLREFRIDPATHLLTQDTTAQTPSPHFQFQGPTFADYVNQNSFAIIADDYVLPLRFPTDADPFRGSGITYGAVHWDGAPGHPIVNRAARHKASLNTCNGCHGKETGTFFTHVGSTPFGTIATLSGFLTGISVNDVADGMPTRFFDDLERRAVDMDALISESCFAIPLDLPLLAVSH